METALNLGWTVNSIVKIFMLGMPRAANFDLLTVDTNTNLINIYLWFNAFGNSGIGNPCFNDYGNVYAYQLGF